MPENPHTFEGSAPQPSPSVTESWGLIDYDQALGRMMALVEAVADGAKPDTIIFCTHPPIVTMGRSTKSEHMSGWTGKTLEVARGGSVTYHGPSQLVVYPIVNLQRPHPDRKPNEIVGFLRSFENAIVETLAEYGVTAIGRSVRQKNTEQKPQDETGVWVGDKKNSLPGLRSPPLDNFPRRCH